MARQPRPAGRRARKGRRLPPAPRPPAPARPRVGPIPLKGEEQATPAPKPRLPGMMDFSYVKDDLKQIAVVAVGMVLILVVLSFVLQ